MDFLVFYIKSLMRFLYTYFKKRRYACCIKVFDRWTDSQLQPHCTGRRQSFISPYDAIPAQHMRYWKNTQSST